MSEPIKVWEFYDAPKEYRKHFDNDDADWLALIPNEYGDHINWMDVGTPFGCCSVETISIAEGYLKVGYHA